MFAKIEMGTWVGMCACKKHMITFDCCNVYTNCIHDVFNMACEKINEFIYLCATTTFYSLLLLHKLNILPMFCFSHSLRANYTPPKNIYIRDGLHVIGGAK